MAKRSEYTDWLCEQLAPIGHISARAMFGGWGVYCDGLIFSLVIEDVCYLKADASTMPALREAGSAPFCYARKDGRTTEVAYWRVPDEALEDRAALLLWARQALGVALRAHAAKPAKRGKPRSSTI
jgi:DNA transformation protein